GSAEPPPAGQDKAGVAAGGGRSPSSNYKSVFICFCYKTPFNIVSLVFVSFNFSGSLKPIYNICLSKIHCCTFSCGWTRTRHEVRRAAVLRAWMPAFLRGDAAHIEEKHSERQKGR
ncbi:MAG: hypothetical protein LBC99_02100, partial [Spirochaetota bacterium]|nr:hypothetical protein [Spirochaetota bacterium]